MKPDLLHRRAFAVACLAFALAAVPAHAVPRTAPKADTAVVLAQGDCYAVGQSVAADSGGKLLKASAETRGGERVCRIVVRVPGKDGERPRRAEFVVPQN